MDWTEKYRPQSLQDLVGNGPAVRQIYEWARSWTRESPPLILYGKPGVGKTSSAHALARDMRWEVVELNASDQRTKAVLERVAGTSSATASLLGAERKLILLDEADNLHGTADRGGARAIIEIVKHSCQPILLIANDLYGLSKELRAIGEPVQFRAIQARSIVPRLREICGCEKIACSQEALDAIARSAGGDVRAAVNMLYASALGKDEIDAADVHTDQKDRRATIFDLVAATYAGKPDGELMALSRAVDDDPDAVLQWLEGNLHTLQRPEAEMQAYVPLARADEWLGLTRRRQYFALWKYATATMLIGVKEATGGVGAHGRLMPPARWRRMGSARKQKAVRASVMHKLSHALSLPQHTIREEYLPLVTLLVDEDPLSYAGALALDADELNFFLHDTARAKAVVKELKAAERERKKREKEKEKERKKKEKEPREDPPEPAPEPEKPEKAQPKVNQATLFDAF
ncbi:replication factor C large subunit [Methanofollis aquaemaris]|uniref:Replication factor C large subunit n=2 Tax=Methanofollis aquaemaris TaxID=126734 RepID=A0A8A3SAE8_9EURY|nr:replication factor C large subunit [Methanofollis aquaemaris]